MTSPREQAIEAAAEALMKRTMSPDDKTSPAIIETWMASTFRPDARAAIDAYEITRARLDGAKMMPRDPERDVVRKGCQAVSMLTHTGAEVCYRAMHDATPKTTPEQRSASNDDPCRLGPEWDDGSPDYCP